MRITRYLAALTVAGLTFASTSAAAPRLSVAHARAAIQADAASYQDATPVVSRCRRLSRVTVRCAVDEALEVGDFQGWTLDYNATATLRNHRVVVDSPFVPATRGGSR